MALSIVKVNKLRILKHAKFVLIIMILINVTDVYFQTVATYCAFHVAIKLPTVIQSYAQPVDVLWQTNRLLKYMKLPLNNSLLYKPIRRYILFKDFKMLKFLLNF